MRTYENGTPSARGRTVRLEFGPDGTEEFLLMDEPLSVNDMRVLEECLERAAAESKSPAVMLDKAMREFESTAGFSGTACAAPYLYSIMLE